jgi:MFS family permease
MGLGRNYWRLWASSGAANLADGIFLIALPLIAVSLTQSPILVAGVAVAGRLPWLFFVLVAGALADRLDRRRTMILVQLLRVGIVGGLGLIALAGAMSLPLLYVAAFVLGIGETLFDTAAQSIMPSIVDKQQLSKANGRLYAVEIVTNQFAGPPLGGLLIGLSAALALGSSAVGYFAAALGLLMIRGSFRPERTGPPTRIHQDIAEGLRYLWRHRLLRTLAAMVGVMNLASTAVFAILVLYAVAPGPMGLSEPAFGLLLTTFAGGSILGSMVVERVERRIGRANVLAVTVLGTGVSLAVPAFTTSPWVIGAGFFVSGITVVMWNVVTVSLRQRIVPDRLLGRINSSYRLLAWGTQPVGALLGGVLGELFGLRIVFLLAGIAGLLLLFARLTVTDAAIRAAETDGEGGPSGPASEPSTAGVG